MSSRKNRKSPEIFWFLLYCGLMLWLLFGQRLNGGSLQIAPDTTGESVNLVPLATLRLYVRILQNNAQPALMRHAVINLVGNVVMFIPLGWFLPALFRKFRGFFRTVFFAAGLICLVETVQFITGLGSCDIDDLILNVAGVIPGYVIYRVKHRK